MINHITKKEAMVIACAAAAKVNRRLDDVLDAVISNSPPLTAFGDLRTAELTPVFQLSFEYTVDNTDLTTKTITGGATVTQSNAMAVLNTSATTGGLAILESKNHAKYRAGQGGLDRFTCMFTAGVAATVQLQGLADTTGSSQPVKNGYMVGFIGTVFGFHRFSNDAITTVAQSAWDDPMDGSGASGMTIDTTKLNVFEIQFQYLGAGAVTLWVEDDSTGEFVKAHTVLYANLNTAPSVHNPNFKHMMCVDNLATTANLTIKSASFAYFTEGKTNLTQVHQPQFSSGVIEETSVTTRANICTIRNKSTYASKTNFIELVMEGMSASVEAGSANNLGAVCMVKNATLGGTPSYSDINTSNSIVEMDTAGTTLTGGEEIFGIVLAGKNDANHILLKDMPILLLPGETLTIAGSSANSATFNTRIVWRELF